MILTSGPMERALDSDRWQRLASHPSARIAGLVLFALAHWLTHVSLPGPMADAGLDPSWQQSLGHALRERMRFGVDLRFTYGPLGYFLFAPYDAQLYWIKCLVFEVALRLFAAVFVALCLARTKSWLARFAFAFAALLFAAPPDAWAFATIACAVAWMFARPERRAGLEASALLLLAILSLCKFTYMLLSVGGVACFAAACWREHGALRSLRTCGIYALLLGSVWLCAGQSLLDLPRYVSSSIEVTSGYSAAMGHSGAIRELALFAGVLSIVALAIVARLWTSHGPRSACFALFAAMAAFLAFKTGFVRNFGHAVVSFAFVPLLPFLHSVATGEASPRAARRSGSVLGPAATALSCAAVALALQGFAFASDLETSPLSHFPRAWLARMSANAGSLLGLGSLQRDLETGAARTRADLALPRVVERVGDASIDLLGNSQGRLHANGLRWTPRPVFQSYAAYTHGLQLANARSYSGEHAPRFVLLDPGSIDRRLPGLDDALALRVLARDYTPVLEEGGALLFERLAGPSDANAPGSVVLERTAAFDQWIEIAPKPPGAEGALVLEVTIDPTWLGRLVTLAFRSAPVWMQVEDSSGRREEYRVVPDLLRSGVLVDPFLVDAAAWKRWFDRGPGTRVTRFACTLKDAGHAALFEPEFGVRVLHAGDLGPAARRER